MIKLKLLKTTKYKVDRSMEFHISGKSREKYDFDEELFSLTGNVIFSNIYGARVFANKINSVTNNGVNASDVFAMGLMDELLHFVIAEHRQNRAPDLFKNILTDLKTTIGIDQLDKTLLTFVREFPGSSIIKGKETPEQFLNRNNRHGVSFKEIILEEMLLLHITNLNPALNMFSELFDESILRKNTKYDILIEGCKKRVSEVPAMDAGSVNPGSSLYDLLRAPALACPNSISEQLKFIMGHWGVLISEFNIKMLKAIDSIKEDNKPGFFGGFNGPVETFTQTYHEQAEDIENFTIDKHWMPNVMLIAKSAMVWLDQLSKKYKKEITTLCQIPDEELDLLAREGFNGLWLIGLWNRSEASKKIKIRCGNPEAVASAYSLYNYDINEGLGGWSGIEVLRKRCAKRGIRLASDMVPNHTGIDSEWVRSKPDYFIQADHPPFPTYTFNSENLSDDPNIGIYLEDHYYSKDDAAVVFKRVDFNSGDTRYIYHGNDGTMMPWNDTAQIDFLKEEVREAVIQDILHVAKNFPIIRFDAAMTLAKKHIQRLWYPRPGHGGDIASRSDYVISQEDFDRLLPIEFWREVVDRIAVEAPETLLLAEAFWMLESYFVRTLGMHRVYNSAFMNMLKNEENQKYRDSLINTIIFDPDILKRYVNFMNNPDEDTAIEQFGSGDKYFGVCTLMVTLPGLPMFGHGQIEGYKEKYGMEYSKAYWDEEVDQGLVEGHNQLIFPLMRKREQFSEVENFNLYPFKDGHNNTNNNVFAYTNKYDGERSLVLYNNSETAANGWINHSEQKLVKSSDNRYTSVIELSDSFGLHYDGDYFCLLTNQRDGLTYIRSSKQLGEEGMFFGLKGYESQVFLDIHEIKDVKEGFYAKLHHDLDGRGFKDIHLAVRQMALGDIFSKTKEIFTSKVITPETLEEYLVAIDAKKLAPALTKQLDIEDNLNFKVTMIIEISNLLKIDIIDEWLFSSFCDDVKKIKLIIYLREYKNLTFLELLGTRIVEESIGVHEYDGVKWFNRDNYITTLETIIETCSSKTVTKEAGTLLMENSEYKFTKLIVLIESEKNIPKKKKAPTKKITKKTATKKVAK
ncbi:MAG: alpha-amylase family glycosyl hydrolase [Spirochaetaceae bacterium]